MRLKLSSYHIRSRRDTRHWLLVALATILLSLTIYLAVDLLRTSTPLPVAGEASPSGIFTSAEEGQDEGVISGDDLSSYEVDADLPRMLSIDILGLSARILPMGLSKTGSIQAPLNIHDAGWYTDSMKPNETGAVFIDGHASGPTREGLFAYIDTLKKGDQMQVELGDHTMLTYEVVHTEIVALESIDMRKVLLPFNTVAKGLNIMTCTGEWLPHKNTYDHRFVVYTKQV